MRLMTALLAAAVVSPILAAQDAVSPDTIVQLEHQRSDAVRDGADAARFYAADFRGISGLGQYETREQTIAADASAPRRRDISVELAGNTAIVTGTETLGAGNERDRVLRIWTRGNGMPGWTIAAAQTTWIGNRAGAAAPSGPLPSDVAAYSPTTPVETALWTSQVALMRSFSDADPAAYRMFSTPNSLRLTTGGDAIARDPWLDTIAKRTKGPLAVVDEVRIRAFGDVGVVTLRGHEANPTRQSWVYLRQDGVWKLHLRYTTLIR
jgi:hypothetical protein